MRFDKPSLLLGITLAAAALCGANLLTGCAAGNLAAASGDLPAGKIAVTISGKVHGGNNPVGGSVVKLWETGTTGYGTGAAQLVASTTTSAGSGSFSFPTSNVSANCTNGPTAYVTASGGDPTGVSTTNLNTGLLLAAVIGPCSSTGASTDITINEVTTVAAAYALSGFAVDTSGSITVGAPTSNAQGLADAVANAGLLANSVTGVANSSTGSILLPTATVNSLANSLAYCINSTATSGLSTACTTLFNLTKAPTSGSTAPTDTFQAALNMAKFPGNNASSILNLAGTAPPFQPTLASTTVTATTAPNDLTLGIGFPNGSQATGALGQIQVALDASDNVWLIGNSSAATTAGNNYVSEITASSAAGGPTFSLGSTSAIPGSENVRWGAFDTSNNLWLSDGADLDVFEIPKGNVSSAAQVTFGTISPTTYGASSYTTTLTTENTATLDPNDYVLAIDGSGNVWSATYGAAGNCLTSTSTATSANDCNAIELPGGAGGTSALDQFGATGSKVYVNAPSVRGIFADANTNTSLAAGELGNIWFTNYGQVSATTKANTTAGNQVQVLTPSTGSVATITVGPTGAGLWGIALDKASNAYVVASSTTSTVNPGLFEVPVSTANGTSISSAVTANAITTIPGVSSAPASSSIVNSGSTVAVPAGGFYKPANVAVDGAGNVWVANQSFSTMVEYSPGASAYLSPYYGFSPSFVTPTVPITAYSVTTAGAGTFYTPVSANLTVGQTVVLSGFTTSTGTFLNGQTVTVLTTGAKNFTANVTGYSTTAAVSKQPDTAIGTVTTLPAQTLFTCTTTNCSVTSGLLGTPTSVAIDRAGSVWTASANNGMAVEIIGTAAPTNPVLAAGQYGVQP